MFLQYGKRINNGILQTARRFSSEIKKCGLNVPYPGVPPLQFSNLSVDLVPKITTLPNGLKIVTQDSYEPVCAFGAFVEAGSMYEKPETYGSARIINKNLFGANGSQDANETQTILESIGANKTVLVERDHSIVVLELIKAHLEEGVKQLALTVQDMKFDEEQFEYAKKACLYEYEDIIIEEPEMIAPEYIFEASFSPNTPYGHSLFQPENTLANLTMDKCNSFYKSNYTAPRTVISAVGVDHNEMVNLVKKYFNKLPSEPKRNLKSMNLKYVGGDSRSEYDLPSKIYDEKTTHILIALQGGSWKGKDFFPMSILNALMGGGSSFSSGGPGKGMYSRLYREALSEYFFMRHCKHFMNSFDTTGIIGIHGICPTKYGVNLTECLCNFMKTYSNFKATDEEVNRAKSFLKSSISMNLENRISRCEDIGRQTLVYGKPYLLDDVCSEIDKVTLKDIKNSAAQAYESPLSFAVWGKTDIIPTYFDIDQYFRS